MEKCRVRESRLKRADGAVRSLFMALLPVLRLQPAILVEQPDSQPQDGHCGQAERRHEDGDNPAARHRTVKIVVRLPAPCVRKQ